MSDVHIYPYTNYIYGFLKCELVFETSGKVFLGLPIQHTEYLIYAYYGTGVHTTSGALWSGPASTYSNVITIQQYFVLL